MEDGSEKCMLFSELTAGILIDLNLNKAGLQALHAISIAIGVRD